MHKIDTLDSDSALVFLPGVKLFFDLDPAIIKEVSERMCMMRFDAGEHLIRENQIGEFMMLVRNGKISVKLENPVELGKGEIVGEMSLLSGRPSKADVVAVTDVDVLALHHDDFQYLMHQHSALAELMTDLMRSRMFGQGGVNKVGKYKILGKLGEGGMSIVYNAVDTILGREVAIKMLKYEIATQAEFKKRFKQEAVTIAKLQHPNILHVIETIEDYSTDFIVMEKLDGYDLKYFIEHQGVFSPEQTCEIISQVAMALEYAGNPRNGGIIHRDIKLANIVLDDSGHVKLMDFGIATTANVKKKNYEGTLAYMAPEVLQRKAFDYRIDIYALGITAYAMLTGRPPFRAPDMDTMISKQIEAPVPDVRAKVPGIPDKLAEFIQRALEKDPNDRISSWVEIQSLLSIGRSSSQDLLADSDKDAAIVLRYDLNGIDNDQLLKDIESVMKVHHADYEIENATRGEEDIDVDFNL